MDKEALLMNIFQTVENTKKMNETMTRSFEEFRKKHNPEIKRIFTINCKAKDLKKELEKIQPELIKKFPNLIVSERN